MNSWLQQQFIGKYADIKYSELSKGAIDFSDEMSQFEIK